MHGAHSTSRRDAEHRSVVSKWLEDASDWSEGERVCFGLELGGTTGVVRGDFEDTGVVAQKSPENDEHLVIDHWSGRHGPNLYSKEPNSRELQYG